MAEASKEDCEHSPSDSKYTMSYAEQRSLEFRLKPYFENIRKGINIKLKTNKHLNYLKNSLFKLSSGYSGLDASQPWIIYWILNSLEILKFLEKEEEENDLVTIVGELEEEEEEELNSTIEELNIIENCIETLNHCQSKYGGFGGGPYQNPHLAPTYAAVNSLKILQKYNKNSLKIINLEKLKELLESLKLSNGSFKMSLDGESDSRSTYCAISIAKNLSLEINFENTSKYLKSCQTYEGGIAANPFNEAHGGYTFCGVAGLCLLNEIELLNKEKLLNWLCHRQMKFSGGFNGRTNKLVDGCYSWWQGSIFFLLKKKKILNKIALNQYILSCCQDEEKGGLRDKPGINPDLYHTNYCLSGLLISNFINNKPLKIDIYHCCCSSFK